jgi:hypothetical protein
MNGSNAEKVINIGEAELVREKVGVSSKKEVKTEVIKAK